MSEGTTLSEIERRLAPWRPAAAYVAGLRAARFGYAQRPPSRRGRRELRRALAGGSGPGGWLRALWALPPVPARRRER